MRLTARAIHGCAPAERCEAHTFMTRPLSSSNDVFLLDFARLFVYLTALEQEITTLAIVIAFLEADVPIDDFITRASTHDETRRYARKTAIHGDMRTSDATANSP